MTFRIQNFSLVFGLILILIFGLTGVSHAVLTMNEIRYLFEQERGRSWSDAGAKEQKDFLKDIKGREEYQEGQFRKLKKESTEATVEIGITTLSEDREERVPYKVRSSYKAETGIDWDNADEKEQEKYLRRYNRQEARKEKEEEKYIKTRDKKEAKRKKEFLKRKKAMERKEERREKEKEKHLKEVRKNRERNKKKLERMKKELEKMRERAERKRR